MTALFIRGRDTLHHQFGSVSTVDTAGVSSAAGEVVTPFLSDRCQGSTTQTLPLTVPIQTTKAGSTTTTNNSSSSLHPTTTKASEVATPNTTTALSFTPIVGTSSVVEEDIGIADANIGTSNSSSRPFMTRTMSSQSDYSSASMPTTPAKRRIIFPYLHHRSSWPLSPDRQPPQQQSDLKCSTGSHWGPGATISVPRFSEGMGTVGPNSSCPLPEGKHDQLVARQPNASRSRFDSASFASSVSPPRGGSHCQRLIMPPLPPPPPIVQTSYHEHVGASAAAAATPLCSILRCPKYLQTGLSPPVRPKSIAVDKIPSVESDIPSLASTVSLSSVEDGTPLMAIPIQTPSHSRNVRSVSAPEISAECRKISFDPRVWIREFQRSPSEEKLTWYTSKDLEGFKEEAVKLIMACSETELVPTGTGRFVPRKVVPRSKAFFSHRALRLDAAEDVEKDQKEVAKEVALQREIRRILIVDPHDICVKLFAKSFKKILPHVEVVGTVSSEDALLRSQSQSFDVVLVEERLKLFHQQEDCRLHSKASTSKNLASGAALIRALKETLGSALFIGVSTRLREDLAKLKAGGADLCWSKPPPKLDDTVADEILRALLIRRSQQGTIREIFANA